MKRKFITNLALLLFLNLLIKPIYAFGIDVGVQNAVGASNYGNYFILLNFSLIFQILMDLGIESFSRREIARHSHLLNKYFANILPLKLLLGLFYFLICSIVGYFMGWRGHEFSLLLVLLINQFLASFILYCRANLGGMHMFRADSILSVLDKFVVIVICGFLLLDPVTHQSFKIEWLIYAQTAAYLIGASLAFSLVFIRTEALKFRFNLRYYFSFLRHSLPYAILILLMATYLRIDSVLLGILLKNGQEQAGIYAQSFRIIEILSNYGYLFTLILLPVFARMIKLGESVEQLTRLSFTLLMVPAIVITMGCFLYRDEIIGILYHEHIQYSARIFGILIFSFTGMCITYIFGTLLTANGSLWQLNAMASLAVAINLSMNLCLIPKHGAIGAAIASMLTQVFTSVCQIFLARKIFRFRTNVRFLLRLSAFILLITGAGVLFSRLEFKWIYTFGLYLFFAAFLSVGLGLLKVRTVWEIVFHDQ